jgi:hypothetical protein
MKTLRFEGYSDDTFGEVAVSHVDYDNCASGKPIVLKVWSKSANDGLFVVGQYCPGPLTGWMIGIGRLNDDDDFCLPSWPMRFGKADRPYSPAFLIDAPDDVTVEVHQP